MSKQKVLLALVVVSSLLLAISTLSPPLSNKAYGEGDPVEVTRLTTDPADDIHPSWGTWGFRSKIAFASDRTGNFDIWSMNSDGTI